MIGLDFRSLAFYRLFYYSTINLSILIEHTVTRPTNTGSYSNDMISITSVLVVGDWIYISEVEYAYQKSDIHSVRTYNRPGLVLAIITYPRKVLSASGFHE